MCINFVAVIVNIRIVKPYGHLILSLLSKWSIYSHHTGWIIEKHFLKSWHLRLNFQVLVVSWVNNIFKIYWQTIAIFTLFMLSYQANQGMSFLKFCLVAGISRGFFFLKLGWAVYAREWGRVLYFSNAKKLCLLNFIFLILLYFNANAQFFLSSLKSNFKLFCYALFYIHTTTDSSKDSVCPPDSNQSDVIQ